MRQQNPKHVCDVYYLFFLLHSFEPTFIPFERSGLFMGVMSSIILPINIGLSSERNFTERSIMKVSLEITRYGLLLMINYESLFIFLKSIFNGGSKNDPTASRYYYDGIFGTAQYMLSFAIVYSSVIALEGVTLTLMSKVQVAPRQMKKYSLDASFVVIFVSALGRLVGDALTFASDLSSWNVHSDIVNSLCFTLIIAFTAAIYVVRKHYFFLI